MEVDLLVIGIAVVLLFAGWKIIHALFELVLGLITCLVKIMLAGLALLVVASIAISALL